ncbi:Ig-like domain (group 1) [Methanophagales archaeon]|nr:Ig-like domain (group 1) [Methanophagales archaeon]
MKKMERKSYVTGACICLVIVLILSAFATPVYAVPSKSNIIGKIPSSLEDTKPSADPNVPGTDMATSKLSTPTRSIDPEITETGLISLSIDGLGTFTSAGTIQVEKPAGATVRSAYMAAADVWGSCGGPLPDGAVKINGNNVNWDSHDPVNANSAWSDVTAIVAPIVDAAPAGIVDLEIIETINLDGSILAVIFDDPNQATENTIVLLFGAQDVAGDTFAIGLAEPIDTSDPNLVLDMSLGISFGYQSSSYYGQHSEVDVNGVRLTSSAGGQDDGSANNGALLTVGGVGDSNANPPDPYANGDSTSPRYDDELYNLIPFVSDGDTNIFVDTINPSNDDNIFFASLFLASTTAVVGEGILLTPTSATNPVGSEHTVTATVQDDLGNPIVDREVTFTIVSGPHDGQTDTDTTDVNGEATFTYTGTLPGTDVIEASFVNSQEVTITSNQVTKEWKVIVGEANLCPDEYRWSAYHVPSYEWDPFPALFRSWTDVHFVNWGPGNAYGVTATITDSPANVGIVDGEVTLGDIPASGSAWSSDFFVLAVDMTYVPLPPPEEGILWMVEYYDADGVYHVIENVPEFCAPS